MGTFLENKVFQKSKISKNFIHKSWTPSQNFAIFEEFADNLSRYNDAMYSPGA